jgi:hypothetical protein
MIDVGYVQEPGRYFAYDNRKYFISENMVSEYFLFSASNVTSAGFICVKPEITRRCGESLLQIANELVDMEISF